MDQEKSSGDEVKRATSWETYKLLNKIKETVHQKRKMANDMCVSIVPCRLCFTFLLKILLTTINEWFF